MAVLTYKKNAKDKWTESDFTEHEVELDQNIVKMDLCEKDIELDNVKFREIRKKNNSSHQTSIITTNKKLTTILIAYNKLDIESKLFQNIIKMICYRAETSFSIILAAGYKKKTNQR